MKNLFKIFLFMFCSVSVNCGDFKKLEKDDLSKNINSSIELCSKVILSDNNLLKTSNNLGKKLYTQAHTRSWEELMKIGVLKYAWEDYSAFSENWEIAYGQRFQNHYSGPAKCDILIHGRRMYEQYWDFDSGKYLFERLTNGDLKVENLLQFGWKIKKFDDGFLRVIPPESFKEFMAGFYSGLDYYRGMTQKNGIELGVPILCRNNSKKQCFIRPGLDISPSSLVWRASKITPEDGVNAPYDDFTTTVGQRVFPMQPFMFDHDFSHVIDYLTHDEFLEGNVRAMMGLSPHYKTLVISNNSETDYPGFALGIRMSVFHEELAIPNIKRHHLIREILKDVFETEALQKIETALLINSNQSLVDSIEKAKKIGENIDKILTRHGGGMNDPYNLFLELNVRSTAEKRILLSLNSDPSTPSPYFALGGRERFSQLAIDSLYGLADDVHFLAKLLEKGDEFVRQWIDSNLGLYDFEEKKENLCRFFYDRLTRIQIALFKGVELSLTPWEFVEESCHQLLVSAFKISQFYRSFAIPGTLYYQGFCDPRGFKKDN